MTNFTFYDDYVRRTRRNTSSLESIIDNKEFDVIAFEFEERKIRFYEDNRYPYVGTFDRTPYVNLFIECQVSRIIFVVVVRAGAIFREAWFKKKFSEGGFKKFFGTGFKKKFCGARFQE